MKSSTLVFNEDCNALLCEFETDYPNIRNVLDYLVSIMDDDNLAECDFGAAAWRIGIDGECLRGCIDALEEVGFIVIHRLSDEICCSVERDVCCDTSE